MTVMGKIGLEGALISTEFNWIDRSPHAGSRIPLFGVWLFYGVLC